MIVVFAVCAVGCGKPTASPARPETSSAPAGEPSATGSATCASGAQDCLAWDGFNDKPGKIRRAPSGQVWETWGALFCPTLPTHLHDRRIQGFDRVRRRQHPDLVRHARHRSRDGYHRQRRHHHVADPPTRQRGSRSALRGPGEPPQLQDRDLGVASGRSAHHRRPASTMSPLLGWLLCNTSAWRTAGRITWSSPFRPHWQVNRCGARCRAKASRPPRWSTS